MSEEPAAKKRWLEEDVRLRPKSPLARERWTDVNGLLQPLPEQVRADRIQAVCDIAAARFKFPAPGYPTFRTAVNVPEVKVPVQVDGREVAPDIVVLDAQTNRLVMHAQVEVPETVTEQQAREKWAVYWKLAGSAFYLFVPVGYAQVARGLLRAVHAQPDGIRTWRRTPQGTETNNVFERRDMVNAFLPAAIQKWLFAYKP